jgi:sugar lactone lactonase YvrE
MKGSYIGKKPSGYSAVSASKTGAWEIYDQGQMVRDTQWTGQPWEVNNGYYLNKKWTVGLSETTPTDVQFNDDGTKLYIIGTTRDTIFQYSCSTAWDVTTAFYTGKSFSVSAQEITPNGLFFKSDGTKFYIVGQTNDTVYQYSCATAWDVSTAFYDLKAFSVSAQETSPLALFFKPDGTKFYIVGQSATAIYQYSCATAWDVSTASYDSKLFNVGSQDASPTGLFFKSDGTKFYVVGSLADLVFQYSCATAWDVSTGSYDTKFCRLSGIEGSSAGLFFKPDGTRLYIIGSALDLAIEFTLSTAWDVSTNNGAGGVFYIGGQDSIPHDVHFKSDGTKFYIVGQTNDTVYQYSCATAWDVSTGSYDSKSFSVGAQDLTPASLFFKTDGTKFYVIGTTNDTIYQYSCATAWDVSTASYDSKSFSVSAQEATPNGLFFKPDGTTFYIVGQTNDTVYQYTCATAWDVSTASYDTKSFSVNPQETQPQGLFFKSDGTKFYIVGATGDTIYQYSCATAWDVSTASYDTRSFSVGTQETEPTGLFFKSDGTRLYIVGYTNDNICQYDLPLAWDVVNAGFGIKAFAVNLQDDNPTEITFSSDGTKLYLLGSQNDSLYQYTCSTAWDVTTAVFNYNSSGAYGRARVTTQETAPHGLSFKSDGTKFYIVGQTSDTVFQYSCATAWDISTASYDAKSFSVSGQETISLGLFFKPDGLKFYVVGLANARVYQYSCATAWDISTASYDSKSFLVSTQESSPGGVFFKSDGTKFYIVGSSQNTVFQYSCATAWDVSTGSYDSKSFSISLQSTATNGVVIDDLGRFLYIVSASTSPYSMYQYSLV